MTPQTYTDWRTARAGCVTASVFHRVLSAKTPRAWITLLNEIRTEQAEIAEGIFSELDVPATRWGKLMEPRACSLFTMETGIDCEVVPFQRLPGLPIGASPDRFTSDGGMLEAKACYAPDRFGRYLVDGYKSAKPQVQGGLSITNRPHCWFIFFDPTRPEYDQLGIIKVERDEPYIAALMARVHTFARHLIDGTEPEGAKFHDPMSDQPIILF